MHDRKHSSEQSVRSERWECTNTPKANEGVYKRNKLNYLSDIKALGCSAIETSKHAKSISALM